MTDEERVTICQKEIRRLRGVVREQEEDLLELKNMFWSIVRGFVGDDYSPEMLYSILLVSGGNQHQHEFLQKLIEEHILEG